MSHVIFITLLELFQYCWSFETLNKKYRKEHWMIYYSCNYLPELRAFIILEIVLEFCFLGWSILIKKSISKKERKTSEKEFRIHQDILHLIKMPDILCMLSQRVIPSIMLAAPSSHSFSIKTFKHAQVCSNSATRRRKIFPRSPFHLLWLLHLKPDFMDEHFSFTHWSLCPRLCVYSKMYQNF